MKMKLTMVSINHTTLFVWLAVSPYDGKVRMPGNWIKDIWGIGPGECICMH